MDGEPSYEQIPQGLHDGTQPFWQEHHVRRYAWWAALAGACGHIYGDNSVMQMYGTAQHLPIARQTLGMRRFTTQGQGKCALYVS